MVSQVTVIGILMIVNGSLQVLMGVLYAIMGPLFMTMFTRQAGPPPPQAAQIEQIFNIVSIVYVVLGSLVALAGVMNISGGISAIKYRSRTFVITALFFNIAPMITCYCLPTSLGLMIWGLIVMFQADVAHAFRLGASGYSAEEIKQRMGVGGRYPREGRRDDWEDHDRGRPDRLPQPGDAAAPKDPSLGDSIAADDQPPHGPTKPESPPSRQGPDDERFFEK